MAYEVAGADARAPATATPGAEHPSPHVAGAVELQAFSGAAVGPTAEQWLLGGLLVAAALIALAAEPARTLDVLHDIIFGLFAAVSVVRATSAAMTLEGRAPAPALQEADLPSYTVLAPLYREPHMVAELVSALRRLDYPADKLQVLILLEAGDHHTIASARAACVDGWATPVICPPGHPRTKPRACNIGLQLARGELVVIYDAEDQPHPVSFARPPSGSRSCRRM